MPTSEAPDAGRWPRDERLAYGIALFLLLFWLPLCGWLFWYFEGRYLGGGVDQLVYFDPQALPAAPRPGMVNILYVVDRRCPCNRGLDAQLAAVQQRFGAEVRQFLVTDGGRPVAGVDLLEAGQAARWRAALPQLPAMAVWRADGALAYVGPLRAGGLCGVEQAGVAALIRRALDGFSLPPVAQDVAGCFCGPAATRAWAAVASTFTGLSS